MIILSKLVSKLKTSTNDNFIKPSVESNTTVRITSTSCEIKSKTFSVL